MHQLLNACSTNVELNRGTKESMDPKKAVKRKSKNRWIPQPWGITPPPRASIDDLRVEA
jgi:hypothetical protein